MAKGGTARHPLVRIKVADHPDRVEDLLLPRYTVGRGDAARPGTVEFEVKDDAYLSRQHCRLVRTPEGYAVENLSPNGTYVNGKKIEETVLLRPGDRIAAGDKTSIEFLLLDDEERAKELHLEAGAAEEREAAGKAPKTKGGSKRLVWVMLAVYGFLGLVVLMASGGDDEVQVADPGKGPYFEALKTVRLRGEPLPAAVVDATWRRALAEHGGPRAGKGPHDWYLVDRALKTLQALGKRSLAEAGAEGDPVAKEGLAALARLEARVGALHEEAGRYGRAGQLKEALRRLEQILEAVPDHTAPIQRFAAAKVASLRQRTR